MAQVQKKIQQRSRGVAAEKAILQATLKILGKDGYAGLTIDRVAAVARASKTTIYRRWPAKEHLVLAVFEQLPVPMPEPGRNLEQDLRGLFGQFMRIMQDSPMRSVMPMLAAECVGNPGLSATLLKLNDRRRAPIRQILAWAMERGELATDTDVELVIDVIQGSIAIRHYFLLEPLSERWIRNLIRLLRGGYGTGKRTAR